MTMNELRILLNNSLNPVAGVNFADSNSAAMNALRDFFEIEKNDPRSIRAKRAEIMALIEEVIDENLPKQLEDRIGDFAEVKTYARDAEVIFNIKNVGKRRAYLTIKKGARGGLYQAARLDTRQLALPTWVETVGVYVTLEEILLGKATLQGLMNNIIDGFVERLYVQVIEALRAGAMAAPAANKYAAATLDNEELDGIIKVIAGYGTPAIVGFRSALAGINNGITIGDTGMTATADLDEIRNRGYVGVYKGTPLIALPNYIVDENTNAAWLLKEDALYILPMGEKPVKVALKGDLTIVSTQHPTGSMEENAHKILGVGVLLNNNLGIFQLAAKGDWDN